MTIPTSSPLQSVDPDSLSHIFTSDPNALTDAQLTTLIHELRRRRDEFLSSEAAKAAKGKTARPKPGTVPVSVAAALDKPVGELSLDDLL